MGGGAGCGVDRRCPHALLPAASMATVVRHQGQVVVTSVRAPAKVRPIRARGWTRHDPRPRRGNAATGRSSYLVRGGDPRRAETGPAGYQLASSRPPADQNPPCSSEEQLNDHSYGFAWTSLPRIGV